MEISRDTVSPNKNLFTIIWNRLFKIRWLTLLIYLIFAITVIFILNFRKQIFECNGTSTGTEDALVWPEQSINVVDRIKNQMNYVPKSYKYEKSPIKTILLYYGRGEDWEITQPDQVDFVGCPVNRCSFTTDRSLGSKVDAIFFRRNYTHPQFERPTNQIWIIQFIEAPFSTPLLSDVDVFNWTSSYRWDSDIPRVSGYFIKYNSPESDDGVNYAEGKTKKVAWFVSNCKPHNNRTVYAKELAKYISVDIYGACGDLQCSRSNENECFKMLESDYKFYLSFENANCHHYVTEKFFGILSLNVLPIVMGPNRSYYESVGPSNSFIHVDDFSSPKYLAAYLHKLDKNDTLYNEYFQWKTTGTIIVDTKFYCRLCAMVHDTDRPPKHYDDINKWWNGTGICL